MKTIKKGIAWFCGLFSRKKTTSLMNIHPDALAEMEGHLDDGKKVNAIKALRNATGLGLKEAKAAVDTLCNERALKFEAALAGLPEIVEVEDRGKSEFVEVFQDAIEEIDFGPESHLTESQMAGDEDYSLPVGTTEPTTIGDLIREQMDDTIVESLACSAEDEARAEALK